jgi:hypothetical protein
VGGVIPAPFALFHTSMWQAFVTGGHPVFLLEHAQWARPKLWPECAH